MLQGGHASWIVVERVEKPTDNRLARSFCHPTWLMLILQCDRPVVGPGAFPHTPPRAWARGYFDELIRSRAEGGGQTVETGPPSPDKRHQEGDRGRVRMSSPRGTARGRHVARPIRLSVGRRVALNRNYLPQCYHSDSRTELTYSNSRGAPAAPRCWRDCAP